MISPDNRSLVRTNKKCSKIVKNTSKLLQTKELEYFYKKASKEIDPIFDGTVLDGLSYIPSKTVFAKLEKKLTKAGALLKGLRVREGLSQIVFAKKIAVTQANLSNME